MMSTPDEPCAQCGDHVDWVDEVFDSDQPLHYWCEDDYGGPE